ncbi:MAG: glycosyltransferase family 39 protein [Desulfobacterales bacterium]|nr:MAG: glycosyltransferase family 39 protein [Desulfobacterales bacterium]
MSPQIIRKNETFQVLLLIALCLALFFFRLGARPIWDIDEGKHAATSKEMVLSGDWITPTFNGEPFYDKPVLHNWLGALAFLVMGFTEFAARLPSAILGTGCVLLTYLLGRKLANATIGLMGGAILATALEFTILCRTIVHDISLVFFVTLALYLFYCSYKDSRHRKRNLLFFYAAMGLAVLAKGPLGLALPAIVIGPFLIFRRELSFIKEMQMGWGILVFLAVSSPWYILISMKNPGYAEYFFVYQNLGSFGSTEPRHPAPFYYYIAVLFGGFFPWSCFLPMAFIYAVRKRFYAARDGASFLIVWISAIFIFFSIAGSKLPTYILPIFPPAALLTAFLWHELLKAATPEVRRGIVYSLLPVVITFIAALIYLWARPLVGVEYETGITSSQMNLVALWLVGSIVVAGVFLLIKKDRAAFVAITVTVVTSLHFFLLVIVPSINPYRSTRELALRYDHLIPGDEEFTFYSRIKESALFYTGRRARVLENPAQLHDYLNSDKRVFCIITRKRYSELKTPVNVVAQQGDKFLISNKNLLIE